MDGITLSIDVNPTDTNAVLELIGMALVPTTLQEFLRVEAWSWLMERLRQRFASEGDDVTGKWAELRYSTQRLRAALGYGMDHPINIRTGQMYNWLQHSSKTEPEAGGAVLQIPGDDAAGSLADKLRVAQAGQAANPRVVKRPVLGMNATDAAGILERFNSWFITEVARGGAH